MTTKTRSYTQDGVTAELWSYDSVRIHLRWSEFFKVFPGKTVGARSAFAFLVVYLKELRFEHDSLEWTLGLAEWLKTHQADIEMMRFEAAWNDFLDLDDTVISFVNKAFEQTRRGYIPASPELGKDEADETDETDSSEDADFLAVVSSELPISA